MVTATTRLPASPVLFEAGDFVYVNDDNIKLFIGSQYSEAFKEKLKNGVTILDRDGDSLHNARYFFKETTGDYACRISHYVLSRKDYEPEKLPEGRAIAFDL